MSYAKPVLPVLLATIWISASEFLRNDVFLKTLWVNHYQSLGLVFPNKSVNGAIWGLWSLLFAIAIYVLATKFNQLQTTLIAWVMAFGLLWIALGNLSVLPVSALFLAVPLSLLEAFIATWIIKRFEKHRSGRI